jgi:hypothetical protein
MTQAHLHGSDLCLSCGLCCDGSLFERAYLHSDEKDLAKSLELIVLDEHSEKTGFRLPCNLFKGCCSIYEQTRPYVCGAFKCKLLLKYETDKINLASNLELIRRARTMQAELTHLLPKPIGGIVSLAEVKRQMWVLKEADAQQRRAHLNFLFLAAKYEMFLRTNFLLPVRGKNQLTNLPEMEAGNAPANRLP